MKNRGSFINGVISGIARLIFLISIALIIGSVIGGMLWIIDL